MSRLWQDIRYGVRLLSRTPGLTAVAILTLAIGIGANTVIFSFVDMLWLRPMPVPSPDRVVRLYTADQTSAGANPRGYDSYPDFRDLRQQATQSFEDIAALERRGAMLDAGQQIQLVTASVVSENFFTMLGLTPELGRVFTEADRGPGTRIAMISDGFFRRQFQGDRSIVGKSVVLDHQEVLIAGVLPRRFRISDNLNVTDIWFPMATWDQLVGDGRRLEMRDRRTFEVYGRLRKGVSLEAAQAEVSVIANRLAQAYPASNQNRAMTALPEAESRADWNARMGKMLLGVGLLVLLIAAANVASLLLARGEYRQRELATRLAVGAGRARLIQQLLTESALLAVAGGVAAVLLANWLLMALPALLPVLPIPVDLTAVLDWRAIAFAFAVTVVAAVVFGVAPAWQASGTAIADSLKGHASTARGTPVIRNAVVVTQVALSFVMVMSAGLLVRSLIEAQRAPVGMDTARQAVVLELLPAYVLKEEAQQRAFLQRAREQVEAIPGVTHAAYCSRVPFGLSGGGRQVGVRTMQQANPDEALPAGMALAGDGYFETIGTRIVAGRGFNAADLAEDRPVAVINETLARRVWPGEQPVGMHMKLGRQGRQYEIIGIAEAGKYNSLTEEARPYVFLPLTEDVGEVVMVVSGNLDAAQMMQPIRRALTAIDRNVPIMAGQTLREHLDTAAFSQALGARLVSALGGLGLLLACVGLYGVLSFVVARRTHEIGIRMALGAQPARILGLVLGRAMRLVTLGAGIGIVLSLVATKGLKSLLVGVSATDPPTYGITLAVLAVATAIAALWPARRATRVDPMAALREE